MRKKWRSSGVVQHFRRKKIEAGHGDSKTNKTQEAIAPEGKEMGNDES